MKNCLKISLYIPFNYRIFDRLGQFYTMIKIGDIIRLKRIEMGISQKVLASQIGVDVSFLCKIEKNEKNISLNKIHSISNVLNIDSDVLKYTYYNSKIFSILKDENNDNKIKILNEIILKIKQY